MLRHEGALRRRCLPARPPVAAAKGPPPSHGADHGGGLASSVPSQGASQGARGANHGDGHDCDSSRQGLVIVLASHDLGGGEDGALSVISPWTEAAREEEEERHG